MNQKPVWIFLHPPRTGGGTLLNTLLVRVPKDEILPTSVMRYQKNINKINLKKIRFVIGHATYYGIHELFPDKEPKYFVFVRDPAERIVSHYNAKMINEKTPIPFDEWYKNQILNEMVHFLDLKFKGSASSRINIPKIFLSLLQKLPFTNRVAYEGYTMPNQAVQKKVKLDYKAIYLVQTAFFNILKLNKNNNPKKLENAKKLLDVCWFVGIIENSDKDIPFLLKEMGLKEAKWEKETLNKKVLILDNKLRQKLYKDNPLDWQLYNYALKLRGMNLNSLSERRKKKKK